MGFKAQPDKAPLKKKISNYSRDAVKGELVVPLPRYGNGGIGKNKKGGTPSLPDIVRFQLKLSQTGDRQSLLTRVFVSSNQVLESQKISHYPGCRLVKHFLRLIDLLNAPLIHNTDPVGSSKGFIMVVGHKKGGDPGMVQNKTEIGQKPLPEKPVKGTQGFVQHEQPWPGRQGAGQGNPLALSAGKFGYPAISKSLQ